MHGTAKTTGALFMAIYATDAARILDIGSMDVNGSLRTDAPAGANYVGVDLAPGRGVDLVVEPYAFPFADESFDAIVSTSCLEHDPCFWLTFLEAVRLLAPTGALYLSAPSNGPYHAYPKDYWRFYPDFGLGLVEWAHRSGHPEVKLIESFLVPPAGDVWEDAVAVFGKGRVWNRTMASQISHRELRLG